MVVKSLFKAAFMIALQGALTLFFFALAQAERGYTGGIGAEVFIPLIMCHFTYKAFWEVYLSVRSYRRSAATAHTRRTHPAL